MVFGVKLVKVAAKEPVPVSSEVLVVRAMVGLVLVDQTTPLAVMVAPPSEVILPPEVAEVVAIAVMAVVVSEGIDTIVGESFRQRTENPANLLCFSDMNLLPILVGTNFLYQANS